MSTLRVLAKLTDDIRLNLRSEKQAETRDKLLAQAVQIVATAVQEALSTGRVEMREVATGGRIVRFIGIEPDMFLGLEIEARFNELSDAYHDACSGRRRKERVPLPEPPRQPLYLSWPRALGLELPN